MHLALLHMVPGYNKYRRKIYYIYVAALLLYWNRVLKYVLNKPNNKHPIIILNSQLILRETTSILLLHIYIYIRAGWHFVGHKLAPVALDLQEVRVGGLDGLR